MKNRPTGDKPRTYITSPKVDGVERSRVGGARSVGPRVAKVLRRLQRKMDLPEYAVKQLEVLYTDCSHKMRGTLLKNICKLIAKNSDSTSSLDSLILNTGRTHV